MSLTRPELGLLQDTAPAVLDLLSRVANASDGVPTQVTLIEAGANNGAWSQLMHQLLSRVSKRRSNPLTVEQHLIEPQPQLRPTSQRSRTTTTIDRAVRCTRAGTRTPPPQARRRAVRIVRIVSLPWPRHG